MPKCPVALMIAGVLLACKNPAMAVGMLWVEGETPSISTARKHPWYDKVDKEKLSGKDWLSHWNTTEAMTAYRFTVPQPGDYAVWVRGVVEGGSVEWQVDGGERGRVDTNVQGVELDVLAQGGPRTICWAKYGTVHLDAGPHTFCFYFGYPGPDSPHKSAYGGIDVLALADAGDTPTGMAKPKGAATPQMLPAEFPEPDEEDWFSLPLIPDPYGESVIDVSHLLHKPAGKHGWLQMREGSFVFKDGTRVKFLADNICNAGPGMDPREADLVAKKSAKFGLNMIRFHKFTHPGEAVLEDSDKTTELEPEYMKRMDYLHAELKKRGVYVGWSPIYVKGLKTGDGIPKAIWDEVAATGGGAKGDKHPVANDTRGLVYIVPEIQASRIRLITNLLTHKNTETGLRYADDPALGFVEIHNEDDVFWNYNRRLAKMPKTLGILKERYSDWLEHKYGSQEKLAAAWDRDAEKITKQRKAAAAAEGKEEPPPVSALKEGEHLGKRNMDITMHGWWYSESSIVGPGREHLKWRMLDAARFFFDLQNTYYANAVQAIRDTGYKGVIVTSNWNTSAPGVGHLYNLMSDAKFGAVDRHAYYGGGSGHRLGLGAFNNVPMLRMPGSGIFSRALMQVEDRPFMISEWLVKSPTMWVAEGQFLMGAYGMCLQDWDGIFLFAAGGPYYPTPRWDDPRVYTGDYPQVLGLNPLLAYWVYRGDIRPGEVVARRNVSMQELEQGILKVRDAIKQTGDDVDLDQDTQTPGQTIAAGRTVVRLTEDPKPNEFADLAPYWDQEKKTVRSNTGELFWDYSGRGLVTINADRSKGLCGFTEGRDIMLGEVAISGVRTPFAVIGLTSLEEKPIAAASRVLVTAMARARNTGMSYSPDGTQLLKIGGPPLQMQGVRATLTVPRPEGDVVVNALDVWGRRTGVTVPFTQKDGKIAFVIGPEYKAVYYEIGGAAQKPATPTTPGSGKPDLNAGLILHYKFDEKEGDTAADSSGNNHAARILGTPEWQPGKLGNALKDGMICFRKTPPTPHAKGAESYTIALWLKSNPARTYGVIYVEGDVDRNWEQNAFALKLSSRTLGMRLCQPGWRRAKGVQSENEVFDGTWHHVVFVDDAGLAALYVDGKRDPAHFAYHRPLFFRPEKACIGGYFLDPKDGIERPHPFLGLLDDVRIYNRALSEEELRLLAASP